MIAFTIYGRLPGLNEYTLANRTVGKHKAYWTKGAKMKKTAQEECEYAIHQQCKNQHIECCNVEIEWYEPNSRRDPDNVMFAKKFIFDALVNTGVLPNDGQKQIKSIKEQVFVDKLNPRIEVKLIEPSG